MRSEVVVVIVSSFKIKRKKRKRKEKKKKENMFVQNMKIETLSVTSIIDFVESVKKLPKNMDFIASMK